MFTKYCVFSKNPGKFATSPSPALGCQGCTKNYQPVHSHCVESFEGLLQRCRRGSARVGLQWIVEKITIFREHPVQSLRIHWSNISNIRIAVTTAVVFIYLTLLFCTFQGDFHNLLCRGRFFNLSADNWFFIMYKSMFWEINLINLIHSLTLYTLTLLFSLPPPIAPLLPAYLPSPFLPSSLPPFSLPPPHSRDF